MITAKFEDVVADGATVGKRLTIMFNNKVVSTTDFPVETIMDSDQLDSYVAAKLSGVFS